VLVGGEEASRKEALRSLASRRLQPIEVSEVNGVASKQPIVAGAARQAAPHARDLLPFFTALTELTASGMSPGEAVRLLAMRVKEPRLKTLCTGDLGKPEGRPNPLARDGRFAGGL